MDTYEALAIGQLIGLAWFMWNAWTRDKKLLFWVALAYLGFGGCVAFGVIEPGFAIGVLLVVLMLTVAALSLLNIADVGLPFLIMVGTAYGMYRERPGPEAPTMEEIIEADQKDGWTPR